MEDAGDSDPSTGPPDRRTLQLLDRRLVGHSLVSVTEYRPDSYEPRLLRARLDGERFPDAVTAARLDIRWFTTGDFSLHYVETHGDDTEWECRWDRHPNEHNTRLHFHRPPNGNDVDDLSLSSTHPMEVYVTVFEAIRRRLTTLWDDN